MRTVAVNALIPEHTHSLLTGKADVSMGMLLFEILGWSLVYLVVFQRWLGPHIKTRLLNSTFGQGPASIRKGFFMRSLLDEATYAFTLAAHHLISGGLMFAGYMLGSPSLWLRGIAFEVGYEIIDTFAILSGGWPYSKLTRKAFKALPLLHHVPTILLIPILARIGLHLNPDVQTLGWSLIGAGGLGFLAEGMKKTMDKTDHAVPWLLTHTLNMAVMIACRLVAFPKAALSALKFLQEDKVAHPFFAVVAFGLASLMAFNVVIVLVYAWKLVTSVFEAVARSSPTVSAALDRHTTVKKRT